MIKLKVIAFAFVLSVIASVSVAQPLDLRVPFDRLMDEGEAAYIEGRYDEAATAYRDARLMRPQSPEVLLNLGLTEARLGNHEGARQLFRESRQHLDPQDRRHAESLYNEGTAWLEEAMGSLSDEETAPQATEQLIQAIEKFGETLEANPNHQRARQNRLAAQNLLLQVEPPPPPPPSPESDDEDSGEGDEEGEDESSSSSSDGEEQSDESQSGEPDDQEGESDPSQDDPSESDPQPPQDPSDAPPSDQEAEPDEGDEEEAEGMEGPPPPPERPEEMTPEEARELLNLLGNRDLMIFRQPRSPQQPPGGKEW